MSDIGHKVKDSPVGPGVITDFSESGYPRVNGIAVAWVELEDEEVPKVSEKASLSVTPEQDKAVVLNKLLAVCCTCKKRNTPEWMAYFAECINKAIEASGSDDRVVWPGSWSNEFHLVSGG